MTARWGRRRPFRSCRRSRRGCRKRGRTAETVVFTRDTHHADYLSTQEGRKLPVPHCMEGTAGWQIDAALPVLDAPVFDKPGFGSPALIDYLKGRSGAGAC
ncbi:MAG: cysteine hydrolase family protein [Acutalibacteraceae bacterium]